MKADTSRHPKLDPKDAYTRVLKEQGRLNTDADWNAHAEITLRRVREEAKDVIGPCGVPLSEDGGDGFKIEADGEDFHLDPGAIYVGGLLCEAREPEPEALIPVLRNGDVPNSAASPHLIYLDVWERPASQIDDPDLVDDAIGVPTSSRVRTMWRVGSIELGDHPPGILNPQQAMQKLLPRPTEAWLHTQASRPETSENPCAPVAGGGYVGLENRLYRVEIQTGGANGTATFKWSRDNGSVVYPVTNCSTNGGTSALTVRHLGKDDRTALHEGDIVEFVDDRHLDAGTPGVLGRVEAGGIDRTALTVKLSVTISSFDKDAHPRLIRWGYGHLSDPELPGHAITVSEGETDDPDAWIDLEDGVQILFAAGTGTAGEYTAGDYWVFAARASTGTVETLDGALPHGVHHHYCPLAAAWWDSGDVGRFLYKESPDGVFIPDLAHSYDVSEDGTTWTFHLREDIANPDSGSDLTANDVITKLAPSLPLGYEVVAFDDFTVQIHNVPASPDLLELLSSIPIFELTADGWVIIDLRKLFPPLTDLGDRIIYAKDVIHQTFECEAFGNDVQTALDAICNALQDDDDDTNGGIISVAVEAHPPDGSTPPEWEFLEESLVKIPHSSPHEMLVVPSFTLAGGPHAAFDKGIRVVFDKSIDPATVNRFTFDVLLQLAEGGENASDMNTSSFSDYHALGEIRFEDSAGSTTDFDTAVFHPSAMLLYQLTNLHYYCGVPKPTGEQPRYIPCRVTLKRSFIKDSDGKAIGSRNYEAWFLIEYQEIPGLGVWLYGVTDAVEAVGGSATFRARVENTSPKTPVILDKAYTGGTEVTPETWPIELPPGAVSEECEFAVDVPAVPDSLHTADVVIHAIDEKKTPLEGTAYAAVRVKPTPKDKIYITPMVALPDFASDLEDGTTTKQDQFLNGLLLGLDRRALVDELPDFGFDLATAFSAEDAVAELEAFLSLQPHDWQIHYVAELQPIADRVVALMQPSVPSLASSAKDEAGMGNSLIAGEAHLAILSDRTLQAYRDAHQGEELFDHPTVSNYYPLRKML